MNKLTSFEKGRGIFLIAMSFVLAFMFIRSQSHAIRFQPVTLLIVLISLISFIQGVFILKGKVKQRPPQGMLGGLIIGFSLCFLITIFFVKNEGKKKRSDELRQQEIQLQEYLKQKTPG